MQIDTQLKTQEAIATLLEELASVALHSADRTTIVAQLIHAANELIAQAEVVAEGDARIKTAALKLAATFRDEKPMHVAPAMQQRSVHRQYQARRVRDRVFDTSRLFGEPAWDMLLDLFLSEALEKRVCITSASIASGVPPTTALRWVRALEAEGWLERTADEADGRRTWLTLTDKSRGLMERYLVELGRRNLL